MLNKEPRPRKRPTVKHQKDQKTQKVSRRLVISIALSLVAFMLYIPGYKYTAEARRIKELEAVKTQLINKEKELESTTTDSAEKQKQLDELNKQLEETKRQLEARVAQKKALAEAQAVEQTKVAPQPAYVSAGSSQCTTWLAQAGIPLTAATQKLIINESGCRTNAVNPSSGACGIPQAYPCSKLPCPLNDSGAICQLQWMDNYVKNRYGTWDNALATWYSRCGSAQGCWY